MSYNKGNGVVLAGLVRRRLEEKNLYLKPVSSGFIEDDLQSLNHTFDK